MLKSFARYMRLAARYAESPASLRVKSDGGIPETFWKLDHPWFHELGLKTVIDVGCNEGQFAICARRLLPTAEIFSFEPIPECRERVERRFRTDSRFRVFDCALGERAGTADFTVSDVTGASSLLSMGKVQAKYFPESLNKKTITVRIDTLDGALVPLKLEDPIFLKIDVQGFEQQVLAGGALTLRRAKLVLLEASFEPFYEGQALFDDIYATLRASGFSLLDSFNMMHAPDTGRALQGDFIFIRR